MSMNRIPAAGYGGAMIPSEPQQTYYADTVQSQEIVRATPAPNAITQFQPQSFGELMTFSEALSKTPFVPKEFVGKPGDIVAAVMYGAELGLKPMQSLQSICVINGKPSVYGDTMLALVRASHLSNGQPLMVDFAEGFDYDDNGTVVGAWCEALRYGAQRPVRREFNIEDARKAGLWAKPGPWQQYPGRMMQFRARSWALRDTFGDVLKGMQCVEEMMDVPVITASIEVPAEQVRRVPSTPAQLPVAAAAPPRAARQQGPVPAPGSQSRQTRPPSESAHLRSHKGFLANRGFDPDDVNASCRLLAWALQRDGLTLEERDSLTDEEWKTASSALVKLDRSAIPAIVDGPDDDGANDGPEEGAGTEQQPQDSLTEEGAI